MDNTDPYREQRTSVLLTIEQIERLDEIAYRARRKAYRHPLGGRSPLIRFAIDRLLANPTEIETALAGNGPDV